MKKIQIQFFSYPLIVAYKTILYTLKNNFFDDVDLFGKLLQKDTFFVFELLKSAMNWALLF